MSVEGVVSLLAAACVAQCPLASRASTSQPALLLVWGCSFHAADLVFVFARRRRIRFIASSPTRTCI